MHRAQPGAPRSPTPSLPHLATTRRGRPAGLPLQLRWAGAVAPDGGNRPAGPDVVRRALETGLLVARVGRPIAAATGERGKQREEHLLHGDRRPLRNED